MKRSHQPVTTELIKAQTHSKILKSGEDYEKTLHLQHKYAKETAIKQRLALELFEQPLRRNYAVNKQKEAHQKEITQLRAAMELNQLQRERILEENFQLALKSLLCCTKKKFLKDLRLELSRALNQTRERLRELYKVESCCGEPWEKKNVCGWILYVILKDAYNVFSATAGFILLSFLTEQIKYKNYFSNKN